MAGVVLARRGEMSEAIDVLAVMAKAEGLARRTSGLSGDPNAGALLKECAEARTLVEELIEAADDVAASATVDPLPGSPLARLDAALAAIGRGP